MLLDSNSKRINLIKNESRSSIFNKSHKYEAYFLENATKSYNEDVFNENFQESKIKSVRKASFYLMNRSYFIYDRSI